MGLVAATGQLLLVAVILGGGALYTRYHVEHLQRADHSQSAYMEDSKAGNGTRYRILTRAAATGGTSYSVEVLCRSTAGGFSTELPGSLPGHLHTAQDEEVAVVQGRLGWLRGRERGVLQAGEMLLIAKGMPHILYNADNSSDVLYHVTHRPAGPLGESFFENLAGLGWDYTSLDRIHPLQVLVLYSAAGAILTDLPSILQPVVKHLLLPVARQLGFKAVYPSHSSATAPAAADSEVQPAAAAEEQPAAGEAQTAAAANDASEETAAGSEPAAEQPAEAIAADTPAGHPAGDAAETQQDAEVDAEAAAAEVELQQALEAGSGFAKEEL